MYDLPDIVKHFDDIAKDFVKFREMMREAAASDVDEATRHYLQKLGIVMDESFAQVHENLPGTVDYMKTTNAESKKSIDESKAKSAELIKRFEEFEAREKAKAAAPSEEPKPPAPEWDPANIDADLRQYRTELLDLLADGKKKTKKMESGDVWEGWSRVHETDDK